jgi:hypothetical protein
LPDFLIFSFFILIIISFFILIIIILIIIIINNNYNYNKMFPLKTLPRFSRITVVNGNSMIAVLMMIRIRTVVTLQVCLPTFYNQNQNQRVHRHRRRCCC